MSSNEEDGKPSEIQDPIVLHENYDITSSYEDDIIPGLSIEHKSLFKVIREAPTGLPLEPKKGILIYMYTFSCWRSINGGSSSSSVMAGVSSHLVVGAKRL